MAVACVLLFSCLQPLFAAEVKNLKMGQTATKGYVTYDLFGKVGEKEAEIKVSLSINGENYPAEKLSLSGDLGNGVEVGTGAAGAAFSDAATVEFVPVPAGGP